MRRILGALLLSLWLPSAGAAEGCEGAKTAMSAVDGIFAAADENRDGALTRAEYDSAELSGFGVTFEQTDLDGDGATSLDEYRTLYEAHHSGGKEAEI